MVKQFELTNLCCPKCATEIEEKVVRIEGVRSSAVNFIMQKLTIEAEESAFPQMIKAAAKLIRRIEPDVKLKEI